MGPPNHSESTSTWRYGEPANVVILAFLVLLLVSLIIRSLQKHKKRKTLIIDLAISLVAFIESSQECSANDDRRDEYAQSCAPSPCTSIMTNFASFSKWYVSRGSTSTSYWHRAVTTSTTSHLIFAAFFRFAISLSDEGGKQRTEQQYPAEHDY